jgi:hypothetical protein
MTTGLGQEHRARHILTQKNHCCLPLHKRRKNLISKQFWVFHSNRDRPLSVWSLIKVLAIGILGLHFSTTHVQVSAISMSRRGTSCKRSLPSSLSINIGRRTRPCVFGGDLCHSRLDVGSRTSTALGMSSLRRPKSNEQSTPKKRVSFLATKLPPPPEDQLSMIGDISCLFLYSFLDHFVNKVYDKWMNSPNVIDFLSASAAIESSSAASMEYSSNLISGSVSSSSLPVWFDLYSSAPFGNIPLSSALPLEHHITYAPAIEAAGMASVLMCCSWLLSGYFTGAFRFKNTIECSTNHAILVTAKTWIFSSLMMLGIAWFSDSAVGCVDCLHKTVGITKADADYIFDSLSVLLTWRYILSSFFGNDNHQGPGD